MVNHRREGIFSLKERYSTQLYFFVNEDEYLLDNVNPRTLLAQWLRDNGYTGTKIGCGQGGCGACTVMLSSWDSFKQTVVHRAVNACMRPLCAVDGMQITTVEGVGNVQTGLDPIQHSMAVYDGTQCGYCTSGFVMNMVALRQNNPTPSQEDVENRFDGNICRCTGYRPILYAMRSLAQNPPTQEQLTCLPVSEEEVSVKAPFVATLPPQLQGFTPSPLYFEGENAVWYRPISLSEVYQLKLMHTGENVKLVVGNTSIGIYPDAPVVFIDVSLVPELNQSFNSGQFLGFGGAVTINQMMQILDKEIATQPAYRTVGIKAMRQHLQRLANVMVRDVGSIAGNMMLVKNHETEGTGEPFPSDLFLLLATLNATVNIGSSTYPNGVVTYPILQMPLWSALPVDAVIIGVSFPFSNTGDVAFSYKIARREQNAHAIVNAGFYITLDTKNVVVGSRIVYGGLVRVPIRATPVEQWLYGRQWNENTLFGALNVLQNFLAFLPLYPNDEGFTDAYRRELAFTLFYKAFVAVALATDPYEVSPQNASAGQRYVRPLSTGQQHITIYEDEKPISEPVMKFGAFLQTTGEAKYTQDLPTPQGGYEAYFVYSQRANAKFAYRVPLDEMINILKQRFATFRGYITARDVPANGTNAIGFGGDDLVFAVNEVNSFGQQIGLAVATNASDAKLIAQMIQGEFLMYDEMPALLTIPAAIQANSIFPDIPPVVTHIHRIQRLGSNDQWLNNPTYPIQPNDYVLQGSQASGSQAHFYMEPQISIAVPGEGNTMLVFSSTQDAATVQHYVAGILTYPNSNVSVQIKRLGGGFGGKETRPPMLACAAAVAAHVLKRPIRLALDREADMWTIGKRHDLLGQYNMSISPQGRINGWKMAFYSDGGMTYDVSFPVMDLILLSSDNAYMVNTFAATGEVCRTNKASNTAMRSFGVVQMDLVVEEAIERAAYTLNMLPEDLRQVNFYAPNKVPPYQTTPYNAELRDCLVEDVWYRMRQESNFDQRLQAVRDFNANNKWRKRGISMMPLKYGVSYTAVLLDQGGALINVYEVDGSILLHHGGVEMGQGINTKLAQVAAYELNVPLNKIRVGANNTNVIANASSTGASTGTDLNGGAVIEACDILRKRLEGFVNGLRVTYGDAWCVANGVDYWNYSTGWNTQVMVNGASTLMWDNVVMQAYLNRIDLAQHAFFRYPYITDVTNEHPYGIPFFYYNYAAACSEVEIDVLTGEFTILRTDILYDAGQSLNPCVDVGQIEGGFIQGVGYVTTEEIIFNAQGQLVTDNTWTYKPPDSKTIPLDFRVTLLNSSRYSPHNIEHEISPVSGIKSSKTTGEPPLVLANTVFFAIKHAIMAAREQQGIYGWFEFAAPATVQAIQTACQVSASHMNLGGNAIVETPTKPKKPSSDKPKSNAKGNTKGNPKSDKPPKKN